MNKIVAGMLGGFASTAPMTASMVIMHRLLPRRERGPLPPRKVTMNVADAAQVKHRMDEPSRSGATAAAHFGYGAAMGALYAGMAPKVPGPPVAKGIGWGLIVWSVSYLGLLPILQLHRPATREPRRRNLLMIVAHIVWGGTLALLLPPARGNGAASTASTAPDASRPRSLPRLRQSRPAAARGE